MLLEIPLIGLGTWKLKGEACERSIHQALDIGYRHIDTADVYQNHVPIGKAIQNYPREKLFLTTKIYLNDMPPERVEKAVMRFLEELQVDYIDLLLIHWPNPEVDCIQTLQAMQLLKNRGIIHWMGVSNFVRFHLQAIKETGLEIYTNQIELHPYLQRRALVEMCRKQGVKVTAYRPLAKGAFESHPILQNIGAKYGKSPSQVVLKWLIQQKIAVIPKASTQEHLRANLDIFNFSLTEEEMQTIAGLESGQRFTHPEGVTIYAD